MTPRTRRLLAGAFLIGVVVLALVIPFALRWPVWTPLVTVVLAFLVFGPIYDRIRGG